MRRALAGAVVALALCVAGSARGDTFEIVTSLGTAPTGPPSAQAPNPSGSLVLPPNWTVSTGAEAPVSSAELLGIWQSAGAAYGIPWSVLAAINKIESNFGRNMGPSSAGAIGWMQFLPGTWLRWGGDYNGDGIADPWNARDAVFSAARYLAAAGGAGDISQAVYSYNHAQWYVNEVLSLANLLGSDSSLSFSLDYLQQSLEKAEREVASLSQQIATTRAKANAIEMRARRMFAAADRAKLIEERSAARMRAAEVQAQAAPLEARLPQLTAALGTARNKLAQARSNAQAQSFDPGTSVYLSSPLYQNGYVFPVGGGPSRVSVGHTHHDYPAADIAAPAGSPVYALADGVVVRAWQGIDPLCGIGMDYRTDDGQTWAYCHMSYREPSVVTGARLTAGTLVGLVGSTGHATGPHLHLGLIPSSQGYPQDEAWFQSFAGIAFRWQDASTPSYPAATAALQSTAVFAIVGDVGTEPVTVDFTLSPQTILPSAAASAGGGGESSLFASAPGSTGAPSPSSGAGTGSSGQGSLVPFSK
jgi:murein DD-endopeptidase MepM/ murein hydrolase activator NlpD